ncbi:FAD binding domain-containing protein [Schinkia azotoformans]|uniref:FAD binding domain-containing protein n=1 Tax=Schinkia azotoformans TaxID=1454 RepID=UPI002E249F0E|nr:FAD binding domain-containing protein [Schinkia azotoformans]MED4351390.1 FAD binding domain-containing protein [Schinkia azotoformans]
MEDKKGGLSIISFDFEYYKPSTISEAVQLYQTISNRGQTATYISGGTEFITFARTNKITTDAIIDLKGIPECHLLKVRGDELVIGAAVSLNKITESKVFPLLGEAVKKVADHTSRNKITIGGNLFSQLKYREGLLALLLTDSKVIVVGIEGEEILFLEDVMKNNMELKDGQFLVQILIEKAYLDCPCVSLKKTRLSKIGYPLASVSALKRDNQIRAAISGVCEYPFRSIDIESTLNDDTLSVDDRITKVLTQLPSRVVDNFEGSAEYREFVLRNMLEDVIQTLKEENA